jgi:hypothetical protein
MYWGWLADPLGSLVRGLATESGGGIPPGLCLCFFASTLYWIADRRSRTAQTSSRLI